MDNNEKIKYSKQFWNLKKSGEKLLWRFRKDNKGEFTPFLPTQNDFNALSSILGYINRNEKNILANSDLLVKLYLMILVGEIRDNETTVFNDNVFKNISNQLSKPVELFYLAFYQDLCSNQLNRLTDENFKDKDGNNVIMDYQRFKDTFTLDFVSDKINEMINLTIQRRSTIKK